MRIGSLFSGIGGLELGLERSGLGRVVWQCEKSPYARKVLAKHWPGVPCFEDVRTLAEPPSVEVLCGGFPCRDLSTARHGGDCLAGEHSGLWSHFRRIVGIAAPAWVVVENMAERWREWVPEVRRDLWQLGYASLPIRVCAADVGAPHVRPRVYLVAHADRSGEPLRPVYAEVARIQAAPGSIRQDWGKPPPGSLGAPDGVPDRMDRVAAAGRAVVPQVAEVIGRAILEAQ